MGVHGGGNFFCLLQEAIVLPPWVGFATRPRPGIWEYLRVNVEELVVEELSVSEYLGFKEHLSKGSEWVLSLILIESLLLKSFIHPPLLCIQSFSGICARHQRNYTSLNLDKAQLEDACKWANRELIIRQLQGLIHLLSYGLICY